MNQVRPFLPPDLPSPTSKNVKPGANRSLEGLPSSADNNVKQGENCGFEGVAMNVRQLLKLINDHKIGLITRDNYERESHRVAGMITIIDEVKSRIQTIQSARRSVAEFRRCNSELNSRKQPAVSIPIRDRRRPPPLDLEATVDHEKERLRRELTSSLVVRKSLQAICSSLSQERQKMASELARKAQELMEMEDYIDDLKAQNDMLAEKIQAGNSNSEHHKRSDSEVENTQALQEHNKVLTEQLEKSTEGYRSLKKELKGKEEENVKITATIEEMKVEVETSIHRIRDLKEQMVLTHQETIKEHISDLQHMLQSLSIKISKKQAQEN